MISFVHSNVDAKVCSFCVIRREKFCLNLVNTYLLTFLKAPPSDAPVVDTAEQVYISSLALLKVRDYTVTCQLELVYPGMGSLFVAGTNFC